ncbi:flagellar protein FlaG [Paenibacillus rhizovicinus]|uniref:Flagellar protein FlaG n=1 Tax=Paenibacillus rhizovicinus TaxID=2704463 RepID=A0A6C0P2A0_9BACL|nr:flagellar protein FlaG [Paenibacillus rhizovicinus]QHW32599.1 flagellar protein FlaG [Paenibacillus rhizovicinus]
MSIQGVSSATSVRPVQLPTGGQQGGESKPSEDVSVQPLQTGSELRVAEREGAQLSVADTQLVKALDRAVKALQGPETAVELKVHEKLHAVSIKVFNKETGDLIREIPPEKTLDLVTNMMELAGLLVDKRV